jgi:hypothetical protein
MPAYAVTTAIGVRIVALLAAATAPFYVAIDEDSAGRVIAVLLLFTLAPGAAVIAPQRATSVGAELGLIVGLSMAITTVTAVAMLAFGVWSPDTATYVLACACVPLLLWSLVRTRT